MTSGSQAGFNLDVSNMLPGNTINLTYTDNCDQHPAPDLDRARRRSDRAAAAECAERQSEADRDQFLRRHGLGRVAIERGARPQPSAILQSVRLDAAGGQQRSLGATVNAASVTTTTSSLTSGSPQLPLFTDASSLYTGAITGSGSQMTGLAGRITVNAALLTNPSNLTVYSTSPPTTAGDTTRSDFLYSQLTSGTFTYSPTTGLGSTAAPFTGTISSYMQQFLSQQANAATSATQLQQGQDVVVSTLQQKFNSTSRVNIDTEMSNLIALQNSYAANAHVMSVVQTMMTTLMQVQL